MGPENAFESSEKAMKDEPHIARRVDQLSDSLGRLDHQLSMLIKRFDPVLSPPHPEPTAAMPDDSVAESQLASRIESWTRNIDEMVQAIVSTHDRLEI